MTDIIDRITELVDEQLTHTRDDYNAPYRERCGRCHRGWHGLKITERVEEMRRKGRYDEDYRVDTDTSPVLCPGSGFIGPMPASDTTLTRSFGGITVNGAPVVDVSCADGGTGDRWPSVGEMINATVQMLAPIIGVPVVQFWDTSWQEIRGGSVVSHDDQTGETVITTDDEPQEYTPTDGLGWVLPDYEGEQR